MNHLEYVFRYQNFIGDCSEAEEGTILGYIYRLLTVFLFRRSLTIFLIYKNVSGLGEQKREKTDVKSAEKVINFTDLD